MPKAYTHKKKIIKMTEYDASILNFSPCLHILLTPVCKQCNINPSDETRYSQLTTSKYKATWLWYNILSWGKKWHFTVSCYYYAQIQLNA